MKRSVLSLVVAVSIFGFTNTVSAQAKIGYISTEELIGSMPETEKANAQLQDYQSSLQQQGNDYYRELNEKDSIFQLDSSKLSPAAKELRRNDLDRIIPESAGLEPNHATNGSGKITNPDHTHKAKAFDAVKATAKESGYTYVLESAAVLVGPPGDDILPLVKKKMGVTDKAPAQPKGAAPAKPKQ